MKFKFENLLIWQKAMELGESINSLSSQFPNRELEINKNYEASFNLMNMMIAFRKNIK